jgi:hypothetical protein
MVSTYSTQPFSMTADTSRSAISSPADGQITKVSENIQTKIKSELTWSQLVHAEIIGK